MKAIRFTQDAHNDLRAHRGQARRVIAKLNAFAATGAGDVKKLVGIEGSRLRAGEFRIIFTETDTEIFVLKIGPRGKVYD